MENKKKNFFTFLGEILSSEPVDNLSAYGPDEVIPVNQEKRIHEPTPHHRPNESFSGKSNFGTAYDYSIVNSYNRYSSIRVTDTNVNYYVCTIDLSNLQIRKALFNALGFIGQNDYNVFVRANKSFEITQPKLFRDLKSFELEQTIKNISTRVENEKELSLFEILGKLESLIDKVRIPNSLSEDEAKKECDAFYNKNEKENSTKDNSKIANVETSIVLEDQNNILKVSQEKKTVDSIAGKTLEVYSEKNKGASLNKNKTLTDDEVDKKFKEAVYTSKRRTYTPLKPIYNCKAKNMFIILNSEKMFMDNLMINQLQKVVERLHSRDISITVYSMDKNNIETLSAIGFDRIELLYDDFS